MFNRAEFQIERRPGYANWDQDLYDQFLDGQAAELYEKLVGDDQHREKVVRAYLQIVEQGIGRSMVQGCRTDSATSVLEHCLAVVVPTQLCNFSAEQQVGLLAKTWNICEGLDNQPRWVGQYVLSRISELPSLDELSEFLINILEPVLSPRKAEWQGSLQMQCLDPCEIDDEFLPGEMYFAAPTVLCVEDRIRPIQLGILLQENGQSRWLGPVEKLPSIDQAGDLPNLTFADQKVSIGNRELDVPYLDSVHQKACSAAGFAVVTATNSQRVWVVESQ